MIVKYSKLCKQATPDVVKEVLGREGNVQDYFQELDEETKEKFRQTDMYDKIKHSLKDEEAYKERVDSNSLNRGGGGSGGFGGSGGSGGSGGGNDFVSDNELLGGMSGGMLGTAVGGLATEKKRKYQDREEDDYSAGDIATTAGPALAGTALGYQYGSKLDN